MMEFDGFVAEVQTRAGIGDVTQAERLVAATLETLGERLTLTEQKTLAAQLPNPLKKSLLRRKNTERFMVEEFFNRVKARAGTGFPDGERQGKIVLSVLKEAVSPGAIEHLLRELPAEFSEVFVADGR